MPLKGNSFGDRPKCTVQSTAVHPFLWQIVSQTHRHATPGEKSRIGCTEHTPASEPPAPLGPNPFAAGRLAEAALQLQVDASDELEALADADQWGQDGPAVCPPSSLSGECNHWVYSAQISHRFSPSGPPGHRLPRLHDLVRDLESQAREARKLRKRSDALKTRTPRTASYIGVRGVPPSASGQSDAPILRWRRRTPPWQPVWPQRRRGRPGGQAPPSGRWHCR